MVITTILPGIEINNSSDVFTFKYNSPTQPLVPFSISPLGAATDGKFICKNFQLTEDKGNNRILVSDVDGNGKWTNAFPLFNDGDWKAFDDPNPEPGFPEQILSCNMNNYHSVGIGTNEPWSKLHVVDGNICISRSPEKAPGSRNGSMLFGEVVDHHFPLGEWGIEYFSNGQAKEYSHGGLNFWKVTTENGQGFNYCL